MDSKQVVDITVIYASEIGIVQTLMWVMTQILGEKWNRILPVFCLIFGVASAFLVQRGMHWSLAIVNGILIGAAAGGFYRQTKVVTGNTEPK